MRCSKAKPHHATLVTAPPCDRDAKHNKEKIKIIIENMTRSDGQVMGGSVAAVQDVRGHLDLSCTLLSLDFKGDCRGKKVTSKWTLNEGFRLPPTPGPTRRISFHGFVCFCSLKHIEDVIGGGEGIPLVK